VKSYRFCVCLLLHLTQRLRDAFDLFAQLMFFICVDVIAAVFPSYSLPICSKHLQPPLHNTIDDSRPLRASYLLPYPPTNETTVVSADCSAHRFTSTKAIIRIIYATMKLLRRWPLPIHRLSGFYLPVI
jgi:hypothetical protein